MEQIFTFIRKLLPQGKQKWQVFLSCLAISFVLWSLLTLSEKYDDFVELEVAYVNLPADKMLVEEPPKSITAKVRAQGFDLMVGSLGFSERKIQIDCSKLAKAKKGSIETLYWLPQSHQKELESAIGDQFNEVEWNLDTLKIQLSKIVQKKLKVGLDIVAPENKGFFSIAFPIIEPDSVTVWGAESVLRRLKNISTQEFTLSAIEENIDVDLPLQFPKGVYKTSPDSVRVFIGVERIKEFAIQVPITVTGLPDSLVMKLFPAEATVRFSCAASQFGMALPEFFEVKADFNHAMTDSKKIRLELTKVPDFVQNIQVEPAISEYILKAKE